MSWTDGNEFSEIRLRRLSNSIPAAYTILKSGSTYYRESNILGGSDDSSSDASALILAAIDALPSTGGVIVLREGVYTITSSLAITDKKYWVLRGSGIGGYQHSKAGQTVLLKDFDGVLLDISYAAADTTNSFGLENLVVDGDKASHTGDGIDITNAKWFWLDDVRVFQTEADGIDITGSGVHRLNHVVVGECDGNGIEGTVLADAVWRDVEVNCLTQDANMAAVKITGGVNWIGGHLEGFRGFWNAGTGVSNLTNVHMFFSEERALMSDGGSVYLTNCRLQKANYNTAYADEQGALIYVDNGTIFLSNVLVGSEAADNSIYSIYTTATGDYVFMSNVRCQLPVKFLHTGKALISTCQFEDTSEINQDSSVADCLFADDLTVTGNDSQIHGNRFAVDLNLNGAGNIIEGNRFIGTIVGALGTNFVRNNKGFITENKGVTAAIATGTAVNHGLASTPASVTVSAAESGPTDIYVDTVGAASFKINFGGGGNKTFYWNAEV